MTIPYNATAEEDLGTHVVTVKLTSEETESEEMYHIYFIVLPPDSVGKGQNHTATASLTPSDTED